MNSGLILDSFVDRYIAIVDSVFPTTHDPLLLRGFCEYVFPESSYGRCDRGESCLRPAIVSQLETQQLRCARHWRM